MGADPLWKNLSIVLQCALLAQNELLMQNSLLLQGGALSIECIFSEKYACNPHCTFIVAVLVQNAL